MRQPWLTQTILTTALQQHDLLHFRTTGEQEFLQGISTVILRQPSVKAPNRRKWLRKFSGQNINKSRVTQLQRDRDRILTAMKKKIRHSSRTGIPSTGIGWLKLQKTIAAEKCYPLREFPKIGRRVCLLNCRQCKHTLVVFLSTYLLRNINNYLQHNQSLYIAGGFDEPI